MAREENGLAVALLGPGFADVLYTPLAGALEAQGHDVSRHVEADALGHDPDSARAEVVFSLHRPFGREMLARLPRLRAVLSPVSGLDGIDVAGMTAAGIVIGSGQTPENYHSMAEAAIMLILACLYDLPGKQAVLRQQPPPAPRQARMLMGKTVGMIGCGKIGQVIAQKLTAWQVNLQATVSRPDAKLPFGIACVGLDELLASSDVIVVVAALNDQTRNLLDEERFRRIKPGAIFVNVARGAIVDEQALCKAVTDGRVAAAALDAFSVEPLPVDSPLRSLPNTILTPHAIGHTAELDISLLANAVDSVARIARGLPPNNVRNQV